MHCKQCNEQKRETITINKARRKCFGHQLHTLQKAHQALQNRGDATNAKPLHIGVSSVTDMAAIVDGKMVGRRGADKTGDDSAGGLCPPEAVDSGDVGQRPVVYLGALLGVE